MKIITIIGILMILAAIGIAAFRKKREREGKGSAKTKAVPSLIIAGVVVAIAGFCFTVVPTGYAGVRSTFGQISDASVPSGFNLKIPFVQQVTLVNTKQQDVEIINKVWGESSDKTPVFAADITVTYQINPDKAAWICANVTNDSDNLITGTIVSSAVKSAMVELDTTEVTKRSQIEPLVLDKMIESIDGKYGKDTIRIIKISINEMDFEESYSLAIAEKSIARQNQEKQAIENQTAIDKAEADKKVAVANAEAAAEAAKIAAQAEADVALIQAEANATVIKKEAEAKAEANRELAESLTEGVLKYEFYKQWDGKLPEVMGQGTVITDITK